jgi:hypothetical protein
MDSSSTSLHDIQARFDCVLAQLKRVLTGSPDAETVSALDRCGCVSAAPAHVVLCCHGEREGGGERGRLRDWEAANIHWRALGAW